MLGESVVIVPKDPDEIVEMATLLSTIEGEGLSGCVTRVNESS